MPKKSQKSGFWPKILYGSIGQKNGPNVAMSCFLRLKRVKKMVLGSGKIFGAIYQKMAEKWPKVVL